MIFNLQSLAHHTNVKLINILLLQDVGNPVLLLNTANVEISSQLSTIHHFVLTQPMVDMLITLSNVKPVRVLGLLLSEVVLVIVVLSNVDQIRNV